MSFQYAPDVLDSLSRLGIRPRADTPHALVREFLNDLYRYELRRLRDRLLRKGIPKRDYAGHVIALRRRYRLLSVPVHEWAAPE